MLATSTAIEKWPAPDQHNAHQPPLLVFADDWGRHPSSCQHLIARLLDHHRVCWVNTIGTRTPRIDLATCRRAFEKLKQWRRSPNTSEPSVDNLAVVSPRMWPWFGSSTSRAINKALLVRQLNPVIARLGEAPVAVTTIPLVADLIETLPVKRWVYYCVDDFSQWPGLDQKTLEKMERRLLDKVDAIIAVSRELQHRLRRLGHDAHLLTHGVDLDAWKNTGGPRVVQLEGLERPLVVFWGVIDARMDIGFVESLAGSLQRGTIILAGPSDGHDPRLDRMPRVRRIGRLDFSQLPTLADESAVLIMPYADLPVTRAIQPLKLKEYLATGKPVVTRDLPATREWSDCLDLATTPGDFAAAVQLRLRSTLPVEQRLAREKLRHEGWNHKARLFRDWVIGC